MKKSKKLGRGGIKVVLQERYVWYDLCDYTINPSEEEVGMTVILF